MSLELSVTLIAIIIAPFVGHLLSARLCEAHSTSLPIMEFNTQAQPLKQVPPLYGQKNPQDLRECAFHEHLSQFAIMCLSLYQTILQDPMLDRNLGRGSFSIHSTQCRELN
jgi:hypothetical protein